VAACPAEVRGSPARLRNTDAIDVAMLTSGCTISTLGAAAPAARWPRTDHVAVR
jgi:hypothetical protein